MSDSDWSVGDSVESSGEWIKNGIEVTTGSVTAAYWATDSGGVRLYLQSGGSTMTSTPFAFSLSYDPTLKWRRAFNVPSVMAGKVIQEEIRHSDPDLEVFEFGHRVAGTAATGSTTDGAHVQGA